MCCLGQKYLMMGWLSVDAPKSTRPTVRTAKLPTFGLKLSGSGRNSNEFTKGLPLSLEAAEKQTGTSKPTVSIQIYISSISGEV